jgi:hypothetical protein
MIIEYNDLASGVRVGFNPIPLMGKADPAK